MITNQIFEPSSKVKNLEVYLHIEFSSYKNNRFVFTQIVILHEINFRDLFTIPLKRLFETLLSFQRTIAKKTRTILEKFIVKMFGIFHDKYVIIENLVEIALSVIGIPAISTLLAEKYIPILLALLIVRLLYKRQ